jgi:GH18 family chitinase
MRKPGTTGVSTLSSNNNDKKNVQISRPVGSGSADKGYKIVCYFTNWAQYRPKTGKYLPEDIDPHLCTHIIYAFGWMKKGKLSSLEANDESVDGKIGLYERMMALKNINPDLKVLLAIGQETNSPKNSGSFSKTKRNELMLQVDGRSERPNSRRCRPLATPVRPSSLAPFLSCASTDSTDSISIGSTPKDLTISAISSLS